MATLNNCSCSFITKITLPALGRRGCDMKKEVKILRRKAVDSLILSIEHFNRPSDTGRVHSVLIFLDHAFEMLFKAIIVHRGGRIREARSEQTIGFNACVRKGISDAKVKFLNEKQALTVQTINSLRDAAQSCSRHLRTASVHSCPGWFEPIQRHCKCRLWRAGPHVSANSSFADLDDASG